MKTYNLRIIGLMDSLTIITHFVDSLDGKASLLMTVPLATKPKEIQFKILNA